METNDFGSLGPGFLGTTGLVSTGLAAATTAGLAGVTAGFAACFTGAFAMGLAGFAAFFGNGLATFFGGADFFTGFFATALPPVARAGLLALEADLAAFFGAGFFLLAMDLPFF